MLVELQPKVVELARFLVVRGLSLALESARSVVSVVEALAAVELCSAGSSASFKTFPNGGLVAASVVDDVIGVVELLNLL